VNLLETPLNQVSKEEPITVTTKMVIPIKVASKRSDNYLEGNRRRFDVYLLYLMDLLAKASSAIRAPNRHPLSIRFTSPTGLPLLSTLIIIIKKPLTCLRMELSIPPP